MDFPIYANLPPHGLNFAYECNVRVRRLTQLEIDSAKELQENELANNPLKVKACVVRMRRLSQLEIDVANKYQANLRAGLVAKSPATRAGGHKGRGGIKKKNPSLAKKLKCNCGLKRKRVLWPGIRPVGLSKKSPAGNLNCSLCNLVVPQQVKAPGLITKIMIKVIKIFKNVFKC